MPAPRFQRVAVLMGGVSNERPISIQSGEAVVRGLRDAGYRAEPVLLDREALGMDARTLRERGQAEFDRLEHECAEADEVRTLDVLRRYGPDWRVVIVGDAARHPWEILAQGGCNEAWNEEPGDTTLPRPRTISCTATRAFIFNS